MSYGDFSPEADPEEEAFKCSPSTIPILPVRFSLLPYELNSVSKPSSIGSSGDYIVRTLRAGFVYIYIEAPESADESSSSDGTWFVFRHSTDPRDINSDVAPANTDIKTFGSHKFLKYEWTDNYGEGEWTYSDARPLPYCWVPKSASKIWMAYSEYRWPPAFFRKGHQEAYRSKIMQKVDLRGQNDWAAFIGDAPSIVEEYKPKGSQHPTVSARLNLSQTGFKPLENLPITVTPENDDCVAMVALFDPMGDVAEMHYRLQLLDDHQKNFHAAHIYPLTIGRFCKQMKASLPARDGMLDVFNDPALKDGWEISFDGLTNIADQLGNSIKEVVNGVKEQMMDEGPWMLGTHLSLSSAEADTGDVDAVEYYTVIFGRATAALSFTGEGSNAIRKALGGDVPSSGPDIRKWVVTLRRLWGAMRHRGFDALRLRQYSFEIAFEAIAVQLGTEIGNGTQRISSWQDAIEAGFRQNANSRLLLSEQKMSLRNAIAFLSDSTGNFEATAMTGLINEAGDVLTTSQFVHAGPTADMPFVRTSTTAKFVGGMKTARLIDAAEVSHASLGLFLSTWALVNANKAQQSANEAFAKGEYTSAIMGQPFQIGVATIQIADALQATIRAVRTSKHLSTRISAEALEILYSGSAQANANTLVNASKPAAGALGRALPRVLPVVAIMAGTVVSSAGIVRGVERDDRAQIASNALMLIGGLMFIPGLGLALGIVGGVIIAIGFAISFFQYSKLEDIARIGFWGSGTPYWQQPRRLSFYEQIQTSRDLPGPHKDFFKQEVARFGELTWAPEISDPSAGDDSVVITSPALADGDTGVVVVSAKYRTLTRRGTRYKTISVQKTMIPGQPAMRVDLGDSKGNAVTVTAKVTGPLTGQEHEVAESFPDP